jgi:hypothetical protein
MRTLTLVLVLVAGALAAATASSAHAIVPCNAVMPPRQVDQARQTAIGALPSDVQSLVQQVDQTVC